MKTRFIVSIFLFFFTIFSSLPAFAESFITTDKNVPILLLTFSGKRTEKKVVPVFRNPLTMEIPSTVTGGSPVLFSYRLVPSETTNKTKKAKGTKVLAVSLSNSNPILISVKTGVATPFYVVQSDGLNPDKTIFSRATAELLGTTASPHADNMSIDWTKIIPKLKDQ